MKFNAFTLSEVLVTLVIIGIISALTVPAFMNNSNNLEYISSFKKAISGVNQALAKNQALNGLSAHDYSDADELITNIFNKQMAVIKGKDTFTSDDCSGSVFTVDDGMIFCITNFSSEHANEKGSICDYHNTTPCIVSDGANLWIDVNGEKKPNSLTITYMKPKDIYQAQIYAQKVIPYGDAAQQIMYDKKARRTATTNTNQ